MQVGAFLLVLRQRGETAAELTGMVRAARARLRLRDLPPADLDWPSYADAHRQLPYFLLAAMLVAGAGVRVLMHGGPGAGEASTRHGLAALGLPTARSAGEAAERLMRTGWRTCPWRRCARRWPSCSSSSRSWECGPRSTAWRASSIPLGSGSAAGRVPSALHSAPRRDPDGLGPAAGADLQGRRRRGAAQPGQALPQRGAGRRRGGGADLAAARGIGLAMAGRATGHRPAGALWRGEWSEAAPVAAVTGTAAMALWLAGRAPNPAAADRLAAELWASRGRALPLAA